VPAVTAAVIPEDVAGGGDYRARILAPLYAAIAPHDPAGVLAHEWLNARGAIVRFDRGAIEIRLCDAQDCPAADLAIAAALCAAVRALYEERWCSLAALRALDTGRLAAILERCTRDAEHAHLDDDAYLAALGLRAPCAAGRAWTHLIDATRDAVLAVDAGAAAPLAFIAAHGTLATRLVRAAGDRPTHADLHAAFTRLRDCLAAGTMFTA
jgi:hypothetical protein